MSIKQCGHSRIFETAEQETAIIREYLAGETLQELAARHYCDEKTIRNVLDRHCIERRKNYAGVYKRLDALV